MDSIEDILLERVRRKGEAKEAAQIRDGGGLGKDIGQFLIGGAAGVADALTGTNDKVGRSLGIYNRYDDARLKALEKDDGIADLLTLWKVKEAGNLTRERDATSDALTREQKEMDRANKLELAERTDDRFDRGLESKADLQQSKLAAEIAKYDKIQEAKMKAPKEGEKTLDREFAKEYSKWSSTGKPDFDKNMKQLTRAIGLLEGKKDDTLGATGKWTKAVPDWMRSGEDLAIQQDVEQAAVASLRAALGSQFTEKEGERIMKQSFDALLSEEENIRKIQGTLDKLQSIADAKQAKSSYFRENRTLQGFDLGGSEKITVSDGKETLEIDPADLSDAMADGFKVIQ